MTATSLLKRVSFSCAAIVVPLLLLDLPPIILPTAAQVRTGIGPSKNGVLAAESCTGTRWRDASSAVSVGAIRWDAWFRGSIYERFLDPQEWHSRVPFYGTILSPSQVQVQSDSGIVMDEEIGFAAAAGLTYWAFNYYHPKAFPSADSFNYGLRQYLSSACRDQINFSLVLHGSMLGPADEWPSTVAMLVDLFQNPSYQKVVDGRPLLYFFTIEGFGHRHGSWASARADLDELRAATRAAGLGDPYIVGLANPPRQAAEFADTLGFDAIGAYSAIGGAQGERPFEELRRANEAFWSDAALTGKKVVPPLNVGWDPRPRMTGAPGHENLSQAVWYRAPEPGELGEHVKRAVTWAAEQPAPAPRTVLVYAWNEHDEGGWLTPTLSEGTARVDALARALRELLASPNKTPY